MRIDHLVVGAATLDQGREWLEERLGAPAQGGGRHATMGTHNLLWRLGSDSFIELLAIDPEAPPPGRPRWFGLDDPKLQEKLKVSPRLIGWVAATDDVARDALRSPLGLGEIEDFTRGDRSWRLTVPKEGASKHHGLLPLLIQWSGGTPAQKLPDSGVSLTRLILRSTETSSLEAELKAIGALDLVEIREAAFGEDALMAEIGTSEGAYTLMG